MFSVLIKDIGTKDMLFGIDLVFLFIRRSNDYFSDLLKLLFPKANNGIRNRFIDGHDLSLLRK